MGNLSPVQQIVVWAIPVIFAITVHEVAHGFVARHFGDPTAARQGRLTLNPVKHIDPIGTLLVPGLMLLLPGNFVFGWAKPVPVAFQNLRNPKRDMAIVAAAGPASNLLMGIGWALLLRLAVEFDGTLPWAAQPLAYMAMAGIAINVILMVLNLLPLPPLDGGRVAVGLLPDSAGAALSRLESYGLIIIVALLVTGLLGQLIGPPVVALQSVLFGIAGLGG